MTARASEVLATLEESEQSSAITRLAEDLPLFRAVEGAKAAPANPASPVLEALAAADADQLTPKQALELIYELKALAADRE